MQSFPNTWQSIGASYSLEHQLQIARPLTRLCPVCSPVQLRDIVCHGRRDGNSAQRKGRKRRETDRRTEKAEVTSANAWWEDDDQPSNARSAVYERTPKPQADRRQSWMPVDDEQSETGWWQKPEERSLQAYAPRQLEAWQVQRLEEAYAQGRRKMKIMQLSEELGLDRTEVLFWIKQFSLKPEDEKQETISKRLAEQREHEARQRSKQAAEAAQSTLQQPPQGQQGFIPYYTRKEMGLTDIKNKRLSADALRTLESVYTRSPFPSDEVIRGMWDLHRVNRETTLQWLAARRAQDGILTKTKQRQESDLTANQLRQAMGPIGFNSSNLLVQLGGEQGTDTAEESDMPAAPKVVAINQKQLATLKSSLPSPQKLKGKKHADQQLVKQDGEALEVGGVRYIKAEVPSHHANKWVAGWRHRRARAPTRTLPLMMGELNKDTQDGSVSSRSD